jgi:O-antigen/teichoic acid export membrane protein
MLKNILNLSFGTILAQIIMFAFSFILSRYYSDKSFGEFAIFTGLVTIIAVISVGSYDKAVMFANSQKRVHALVALISLSSFFFALVSSIVLISISYLFAEFEGKFGAGVYFVPLGVALAAGYQIFLFTHLRSGAMRRLSIAKIVQSISTGGLQFLLAATLLVPGLVVGHLFGQVLCIGFLIYFLKKSGFTLSDLHPKRMIGTARKFQVYPRYTLPNELIDNASTQIQTILIGVFFGLGALGQFAFGLRILSAPAALVGQAVGHSFFHAIRSEDQTHASVLSAMYRIWIGLAAIAIIPFTVLMIFGPALFMFLFGESWAFAGEVAQYSSPLLFFRFISSPTSIIYLKLDLQRKQIWFSVATILYRIIPLFLYLFSFSFIFVLVIINTMELIAIFLYNYYAVHILRKRMTLENRSAVT